MDGYKYVWIPNFEERPEKRTLRNLVEFELFDLRQDPGETRNLYTEEPEIAATHHRALGRLLRESMRIAEALREQRGTDEVGVEDDVVDALRALGYVE